MAHLGVLHEFLVPDYDPVTVEEIQKMGQQMGDLSFCPFASQIGNF